MSRLSWAVLAAGGVLLASGVLAQPSGALPGAGSPPQAAAHEAVYCAPPSPPPPESMRPPRPTPKPDLPSCINEEKHIQTCRHGEVAKYNAAIETFNRDVQDWNAGARRYVDAMNDWQRAAGRYANCEIDSMNAELPR